MSFAGKSSSETKEAEVIFDDQKKINRFAQLNGKEEELDFILKGLKVQLDNIEEANNELMLADDGLDELEDDFTSDETTGTRDLSNIHFRIGESFIAVNKDDAEQLLESKKKELELRLKELERQIAPMKEEMSIIKAQLYAKFGNNINLDNEEEAE